MVDEEQEKEEKQTHRKGRKKAYLLEDSCVICGGRPVETGRIFHGHCVCEDCVDYIVNIPNSKQSDRKKRKPA